MPNIYTAALTVDALALNAFPGTDQPYLNFLVLLGRTQTLLKSRGHEPTDPLVIYDIGKPQYAEIGQENVRIGDSVFPQVSITKRRFSEVRGRLMPDTPSLAVIVSEPSLLVRWDTLLTSIGYDVTQL